MIWGTLFFWNPKFLSSWAAHASLRRHPHEKIHRELPQLKVDHFNDFGVSGNLEKAWKIRDTVDVMYSNPLKKKKKLTKILPKWWCTSELLFLIWHRVLLTSTVMFSLLDPSHWWHSVSDYTTISKRLDASDLHVWAISHLLRLSPLLPRKPKQIRLLRHLRPPAGDFP